MIHRELLEVSRKEMLKHSEMCIDHNTGNKLQDKHQVSIY